MNENEECPNCLGTGEEINMRYSKSKVCNTCKGKGSVEPIIASAFISENIPDFDGI